MRRLSKEEARRLLLERQGLSGENPFGSGESATLKAIRRLGYVQIDTISVVARAQHHTLFNRNFSYRPAHLSSLLEKRKVFEYWTHAAAYLPMESYRFCLPRMRAYARRDHWFPRDKRLMRRVLDQLRAEGPLKAGKIGPPKVSASGNWYEWSPVKKALSHLFMEGKVTVVRREGFQKIYGLMDGFLPPGADTRVPSPREAARFHILSCLNAVGLATAGQMSYLRRKEFSAEISRETARMAREGELEPLRVDGLPDAYYARPGERVPGAPPREARLLSPFDGSVIQRRRLKELFDFDYQIECYLPAPKRPHGYFCLPVLLNGEFVGRLDCKAHRKEKRFEIRKASWETGRPPAGAAGKAVRNAVEKFARFNGCERVG